MLNKYTISQIEKIVGSLSKTQKMPGYSWSTPAQNCILGSILAKKEGSVCNKCYALKGRYVFPSVQKAMQKRLVALQSLDKWQTLMAELIRRKTKKVKFFRWFDSGDLQSDKHLAAIVAIAKALPNVKFWMPTKERKIISDWVNRQKTKKKRTWPKNLVVRISAPMIGQKFKEKLLASTVGTKEGFLCEAKKRGGYCGPCRACWNPEIQSIDYELH